MLNMLGVLMIIKYHQNFKLLKNVVSNFSWIALIGGFEQQPGLSGSIVQVSIQLDMNFGKLLLRPQMEGTWTGIVRGRLPSYLSIVHCIHIYILYIQIIYIITVYIIVRNMHRRSISCLPTYPQQCK